MLTVNIYDAKTHFSSLIERVSHGEEIIIGKNGNPVAKLIPFQAKQHPRKPGYWKGKVVIKSDFDELPKSLKDAFSGDEE
jgi:prevent-host-death family protein